MVVYSDIKPVKYTHCAVFKVCVIFTKQCLLPFGNAAISSKKATKAAT